ncbi:protein of unknown function [Cupriavidus taiwanensis]|uniref:Uncharacterized protein n=1 Tax=Cupriavidus taiwanensis TaxID=164546 RepID=A0A7Z7J9A6_9BURK|nr:protein of unknown function [Cupriavidus taiwanensis]SOZ02951.1 hypothetical protein CBM2597_A110015 [Cupriavidus taiwanensis]SOZ06228.1 hypothetical protein CBM2595_A80913 [Cupriavidus taiwanensis]SPC18758.1 hypothetical protein CBM2594_A80197 [Cupriavidus taiwanensis]SPD41110.1 protein of unknown function [Cupriavidus taiwanensis]
MPWSMVSRAWLRHCDGRCSHHGASLLGLSEILRGLIRALRVRITATTTDFSLIKVEAQAGLTPPCCLH